jgi:rhodanese-related sulfurtransferase
MNKIYIALISIAVLLALGILLMDDNRPAKQIDLKTLVVEYNDPSRFLHIDEVTDRIIQGDPGLLLIDVRPQEQYSAFALPTAINIPVDSLLSPSAMEYLQMPGMDKVLYSNSGELSDQAWLICRRLDVQDVFVMDGGINHWFNAIVKAVPPAESAPLEAFDTYSFRVAANQHFYGKKEGIPVQQNQKKVVVQRAAPSVKSGGGC